VIPHPFFFTGSFGGSFGSFFGGFLTFFYNKFREKGHSPVLNFLNNVYSLFLFFLKKICSILF